MKITVVGASGLIGTKVVELLASEGHDVVASSRGDTTKTVVVDPEARYFGAALTTPSLITPG